MSTENRRRFYRAIIPGYRMSCYWFAYTHGIWVRRRWGRLRWGTYAYHGPLRALGTTLPNAE